MAKSGDSEVGGYGAMVDMAAMIETIKYYQKGRDLPLFHGDRN